jgi:hypothetical protein
VADSRVGGEEMMRGGVARMRFNATSSCFTTEPERSVSTKASSQPSTDLLSLFFSDILFIITVYRASAAPVG